MSMKMMKLISYVDKCNVLRSKCHVSNDNHVNVAFAVSSISIKIKRRILNFLPAN